MSRLKLSICGLVFGAPFFALAVVLGWQTFVVDPVHELREEELEQITAPLVRFSEMATRPEGPPLDVWLKGYDEPFRFDAGFVSGHLNRQAARQASPGMTTRIGALPARLTAGQGCRSAAALTFGDHTALSLADCNYFRVARLRVMPWIIVGLVAVGYWLCLDSTMKGFAAARRPRSGAGVRSPCQLHRLLKPTR